MMIGRAYDSPDRAADKADYDRFDEEKAQKQQRMELVMIVPGYFHHGGIKMAAVGQKGKAAERSRG
ncbi:hypothetical protein ACP26L_29660 [Paenibacillus sp. S-38]|uniref:hypothetical protein n=1 Tax=Paenibacillus sp. S-38 TaxID=3416710 RepID=UPI003CF6974A